MSNHEPPAPLVKGETSRWYIQRQRSRQLGPFTTEEIREGIRSGEIPVDSVVNEVGGKQWLPLSAVAEFADVAGGMGAPSHGLGEAERALQDLRTTPTSVRPAQRFGTASASAPRPARAASTHASLVGIALAVVAMTHAVLQLSVLGRLGARPQIFDGLRRLQGVALTREAFSMAAASVLLIAMLRRRSHPKSGTLLAFSAAFVLLFGSLLLASASLFAAVRSPSWSLLPSPIRRDVLAQQLVAPTLFTLLGTLLLWLLGTAERRRSIAVAGAVIALLGVCVAGAVRSLTREREIVVLRSIVPDAPLPTFGDREALRNYLEAAREGTAGVDRVIAGLGKATVVLPRTRARWIDDLVLSTTHGSILGREVELLEGEHRGQHVFVPLLLELATSPSTLPSVENK
jgi:hypothetical protein